MEDALMFLYRAVVLGGEPMLDISHRDHSAILCEAQRNLYHIQDGQPRDMVPDGRLPSLPDGLCKGKRMEIFLGPC